MHACMHLCINFIHFIDVIHVINFIDSSLSIEIILSSVSLMSLINFIPFVHVIHFIYFIDSFMHCLIHLFLSFGGSFIHSPTVRSFNYSIIHSFIHALFSFIQWCISFIHSLIHSCINSLHSFFSFKFAHVVWLVSSWPTSPISKLTPMVMSNVLNVRPRRVPGSTVPVVGCNVCCFGFPWGRERPNQRSRYHNEDCVDES